jgi:hypothetical protein
MQQLDYSNENGVFSMWSVPRCYNREVWSLVQFSQFFTEVCEERICKREAEESPSLGAVTRERLMKTQQVGKALTCAVVICGLWRSAVAL